MPIDGKSDMLAGLKGLGLKYLYRLGEIFNEK